LQQVENARTGEPGVSRPDGRKSRACRITTPAVTTADAPSRAGKWEAEAFNGTWSARQAVNGSHVTLIKLTHYLVLTLSGKLV
jgi:hypothetical protein